MQNDFNYEVKFPDSKEVPRAYRGKIVYVLAEHADGEIVLSIDGDFLTGRAKAIALKQYPKPM